MSNVKIRLTILNFLQFFVWGTWLLSFGKYLNSTLGFTGEQIGAIFMAVGIGAIFMPALMGILADRYIKPNNVFAALHILGAGMLFLAAQEQTFSALYPVMLIYLMLYMPTISLNNSISYEILKRERFDVVKAFPPIRVWGTIGFIIAVWIVDFLGWGVSENQLYFAAAFSLILGLYSLTFKTQKPAKTGEKFSLYKALGLDAFVLFKERKMAVFFIFSILLGAALQITNMWGEAFIHDFGSLTEFKDTFAVKNNGIIMSISQMSEVLFILTIPFFLKRFGIKKVMLMSMFAWVLRFMLFSAGGPVGIGLALIILSNIVYGMAFDFFNISGSLFVEKEAKPEIRGSAQGLFIIMANGFGAMIGAYFSGWIIDLYTTNGVKDWDSIWAIFGIYALIVAIAFMILFKYKHNPEEIKKAEEAGKI
ncbi:nucleoside permease [Salinivirga cyanobacteriivorans]